MTGCLFCRKSETCSDYGDHSVIAGVGCSRFTHREASASQGMALEWRPCTHYINGWCLVVPGKPPYNAKMLQACPVVDPENAAVKSDDVTIIEPAQEERAELSTVAA